jgi:hypothetical protein
MHRLNHAEWRIQYMAQGIRLLIFRANTGQTIAIEFDETKAAALAALMLEPHPGCEKEPVW